MWKRKTDTLARQGNEMQKVGTKYNEINYKYHKRIKTHTHVKCQQPF